MTSKDDRLGGDAALRRRAEEVARGKAAQSPGEGEALSLAEAQSMLHELRVHQIELEMQGVELRRAQVELEAARAHYADLYDLAPVGYCVVSKEGTLLQANLTAATQLGAARSVLVKQPLTRFIHRDDQDIYYLHHRRLTETGEQQQCEMRMVKPDGTAFWARLEATAAQDGGGVAVCRVVMSDITERKHAEEALRESEALHQSIFSASPDNIMITDMLGRFRMVSPSALTMFGYEGEEGILGRSLAEFLVPEDRERAQVSIALMFEGAYDRPDTYRGLRADGSEFPIEVNGEFIRDAHGQPTGMVFIVRDITARKEAEQDLAAAAGQWRQTFDAMTDAVALFDGDARVLNCNAATEAFSGRPYEEIIGRPCYEVFHGADQFHADCPQRRALASGQTETSFIEQDGRWLRISFHPLFDADGEPAGGVHVVSDVSELKRAERSLRESLGAQEAVTEGVIEALVRIVEARDPFTAGHQRRVSELAVAMARRLGLDEARVEGLRVGGLLHDVGKITIPAEILSKPGRLTAMEFALIKGHAEAGEEILQAIPFSWPIAAMAAQHHEREDGSGYPAGLSGEAILPEARLLAVADVVEAMASHRPYRPAPGIAAALAEIHEGAGARYDTAAVAACEQVFAEGFGFGDDAAT